VPLDDFLIYTYIPDANLGLYDSPKFEKFHFQIDLPESKTMAYIYIRDHMIEFMEYLDLHFEPILYSTGEKLYVDKVLV
jgi:hypothetical protein